MKLTLAAFLTALFAFAGAAQASKAEVYTPNFGKNRTVAVLGYDTVAYFTEGKPVKGSDAFTTEYKGVTWRFSSAENLEKFTADPEAFRPQYGGYCAWAVGAKNSLFKGDPNYWKIVDGKLYLNFNEGVQETWEEDIPGFIVKANANWPSVLDK